MTRAAFSGQALNPPKSTSAGVNLVIGLQGAFSINRFLAERRTGREGAPYASHRKIKSRIALTWSKWDSATPLADLITLANYAGAKAGYKRASDKRYSNHFSFYHSNNRGELTADSGDNADNKTVMMINASDLIKYNVLGTGGGAHSDIYNIYLGRLLSEIMKANGL